MRRSMVKVSRYGRMVRYMKASGSKTWLKERAVCITPMETYMKEYDMTINDINRIGWTIMLQVLVFIIMQMEPGMKVNGKKICSMVRVLKLGWMELDMRVITKMG